MNCPSTAEKVVSVEHSTVQMIKLHLKLVVMKDQETSCTKVEQETALVVSGIPWFFPNKGVKEGHCQPPGAKKTACLFPKYFLMNFKDPYLDSMAACHYEKEVSW